MERRGIMEITLGQCSPQRHSILEESWFSHWVNDRRWHTSCLVLLSHFLNSEEYCLNFLSTWISGERRIVRFKDLFDWSLCYSKCLKRDSVMIVSLRKRSSTRRFPVRRFSRYSRIPAAVQREVIFFEVSRLPVDLQSYQGHRLKANFLGIISVLKRDT